MSQQCDLFNRAADCDRLMNSASNAIQKEAFKQLRNMWIALANESPVMSVEKLAKEIAAIEHIQAFMRKKEDAVLR